MTEPAVFAAKEVALFFMDFVLTVHTVNGATEDIAGTVVETDSDDAEHKLQLTSKSVVKFSIDIRGEVEHILDDLSVSVWQKPTLSR